MFNNVEIQEIVDIINKHYSLLMIHTLGEDILSEEDKLFLVSQGVDIDTVKVQFPEYLQMFMLGRLTAILKESQTKQLTNEDSREYLEKGQFIPLSDRERKEYEFSRSKSYNHIKGLADKIVGETRDILLEQNKMDVISQEISQGVKDRLGIKKVVSNLGHRLEEWDRDWERIVRTEMQDIYNNGRLMQLLDRYGLDIRLWKQTYEGACRHCIRLHLHNGLNSEPILFTPEVLVGNGTNIGRKVADWKAVVGPTHPYCRCDIRAVHKGQVWDEESKQFVYKDIERKVIRTSKIKIRVGSKYFEIFN